MTMQSGNLKTSGTIGQASRAVVAQSLTGQRRGEIALGKSPLEPSASLALRRPEEVEGSLQAYCERCSGQPIVIERRMMFPETGPVYSIVTGLSWTLPPDAVEECRKAVVASMRSAPEDLLAQAFYKLRIVTRGREQRSEDNAEAEAVVWIERLRCWPGDIALSVLGSWPSRENGQWWPTWHEVEAELKARSSPRQALLAHIENPPPPRQLENKRPSAEERAALVEKYQPKKPEPEPVKRMTEEELKADLAAFRERFAAMTISAEALARLGLQLNNERNPA